MARIEKSITIQAPPERVFAYVEEPANIPEYWPSLSEVKDMERLPNGGYKYGWTYNLAGVRFDGGTETIEFIANRRTVSESAGGVSSTIVWTYEPENGGTRVTFEAEYHVNIPVLRELASSFLAKLNENESEAILANVKAKTEA